MNAFTLHTAHGPLIQERHSNQTHDLLHFKSQSSRRLLAVIWSHSSFCAYDGQVAQHNVACRLNPIRILLNNIRWSLMDNKVMHRHSSLSEPYVISKDASWAVIVSPFTLSNVHTPCCAHSMGNTAFAVNIPWFRISWMSVQLLKR